MCLERPLIQIQQSDFNIQGPCNHLQLIFDPLNIYIFFFIERDRKINAYKFIKVSESQRKQIVYTNRNAYKMCENTRFVFLLLSAYSHVCPLSYKCTTNVWLAGVFKLLFSAVSVVHGFLPKRSSQNKTKALEISK